MTDYTELVKALRCELHYTSCPETNCKYICHDTFCDTYRLMIDAADAIEALQAEVDTLKRTDSKRCQECLYLGQPAGEQQLPKRGEEEVKDYPPYLDYPLRKEAQE